MLFSLMRLYKIYSRGFWFRRTDQQISADTCHRYLQPADTDMRVIWSVVFNICIWQISPKNYLELQISADKGIIWYLLPSSSDQATVLSHVSTWDSVRIRKYIIHELRHANYISWIAFCKLQWICVRTHRISSIALFWSYHIFDYIASDTSAEHCEDSPHLFNSIVLIVSCFWSYRIGYKCRLQVWPLWLTVPARLRDTPRVNRAGWDELRNVVRWAWWKWWGRDTERAVLYST